MALAGVVGRRHRSVADAAAMSKAKHLIDEDALVYCPIRGMAVDVETCLGCRRLEEYDLDSRWPSVMCRVEDDQPEQRAGSG